MFLRVCTSWTRRLKIFGWLRYTRSSLKVFVLLVPWSRRLQCSEHEWYCGKYAMFTGCWLTKWFRVRQLYLVNSLLIAIYFSMVLCLVSCDQAKRKDRTPAYFPLHSKKKVGKISTLFPRKDINYIFTKALSQWIPVSIVLEPIDSF